jgi:hypothetical protein
MTGFVTDFATRLAGGLALALLCSPWRLIPPKYFRTLSLVLLGFWILTTFDLSTQPESARLTPWALSACVTAFASSVLWGLGLPRLGQLMFLLLCVASGFVQQSTMPPEVTSHASLAISRLSSAFLLGSTLAAMLLGHHYLTAPAMSIAPLTHMLRLMALALGAQVVLAIFALFRGESAGSSAGGVLLLGMRWGFGLLGPAVGLYLAWRTAAIRSTQSATGILYATMTLVLLGELAGVVLGRALGLAY